ncbi:hypothetical protein [Rhizobium sp. BR 315]|uniref:hypothetical protein n=1 Tax=Rhizobium sp. BR 315 TaxID=3040014 RepID=UPI003D35084D
MRRVLSCLLASIVTTTIAHSDDRLASEPYEKTGVVNCALPGTVIEFGLNGSGGAIVSRASSNYAPFQKAAKIKTWAATTVAKDGVRMLILDNLNKTRIMVRLPDGKGMAFTNPEGVSDILCQILVTPD